MYAEHAQAEKDTQVPAARKSPTVPKATASSKQVPVKSAKSVATGAKAASGARQRVEAKPRNEVSTPEGRLNEESLQWILGYQLAQASIVTIRNYQDVAGEPFNLKTVEYTMLALIQENPGVSPAQLAKALGLSAPYVTTGLEKLSRRGLVAREINANDGRRHHLSVTKAGAELGTKMTRLIHEGERANIKTLSAAEQLMLAELLHKLARSRPHVGHRR